jgi:hypothetical protein
MAGFDRATSLANLESVAETCGGANKEEGGRQHESNENNREMLRSHVMLSIAVVMPLVTSIFLVIHNPRCPKMIRGREV